MIDDQSPDGTGELADELARADPAIDVLHRAAKEGLGRAYVDGFRRALASARGYTHIITMDADFSHDPAYLDPLIAACEAGADAAIGSRWVAGGGVTQLLLRMSSTKPESQEGSRSQKKQGRAPRAPQAGSGAGAGGGGAGC